MGGRQNLPHFKKRFVFEPHGYIAKRPSYSTMDGQPSLFFFSFFLLNYGARNHDLIHWMSLEDRHGHDFRIESLIPHRSRDICENHVSLNVHFQTSTGPKKKIQTIHVLWKAKNDYGLKYQTLLHHKSE